MATQTTERPEISTEETIFRVLLHGNYSVNNLNPFYEAVNREYEKNPDITPPLHAKEAYHHLSRLISLDKVLVEKETGILKVRQKLKN